MNSLYDRALLEVGDSGVFQKKFDYIYNAGLVTFWSMAYISIILCLVVVPHTCQTPEKPENYSEHEWKLHYLPTYVDVSGQIEFESCIKYSNPDVNNDTHACDEYEYDKTWYEWTASSENDWVCKKELYVANILAFGKIGEAVGSIIFGWIGDVYGRRPTILISLLMLIIGRFIALIARHSYVLFAFGCVFASLPSWSVPQSTSVISMEISSPTRLTVISTLRLASYSFGMAIMATLYWLLRDWKIILLVTTAPLIPFLICSWKIIESPRWLYTKGRNSTCVKHLKKIAKVNKKQLDEGLLSEILTAAPPENKSKVSPLVLFAGKRLTINTILQIILWASISVSYSVLVLQSGEKEDGNPFFEFAWQCLAEMPANFIGAWLADNLGRRRTTLMANTIITLIWILFTVRETSGYIWIKQWWIGSLIMITGRLSTFVSYYVLNLFSMELYPTCLRQSGMALGNITSSGASAIAPYILYLGRTFDARVSGIILILSSAASVIVSPFLPETLNAKIPETIEEAQNFGIKHKRTNSA